MASQTPLPSPSHNEHGTTPQEGPSSTPAARPINPRIHIRGLNDPPRRVYRPMQLNGGDNRPAPNSSPSARTGQVRKPKVTRRPNREITSGGRRQQAPIYRPLKKVPKKDLFNPPSYKGRRPGGKHLPQPPAKKLTKRQLNRKFKPRCGEKCGEI